MAKVKGKLFGYIGKPEPRQRYKSGTRKQEWRQR